MKDIGRIDKIIQLALLVASEEDDFRDRKLGPIHLIKYVYLADLAYAQKEGGQTFTGVQWQFYKFGPWTQAVNERIEPALLSIDAEKYTYASDFEDKDDCIRWQSSNDSYLKEIERSLPLVVTATVRRFVHRYGQATSELLAYVYSTEPMRKAAPNEFLNFTELRTAYRQPVSAEINQDSLSARQKKKLKSKMEILRTKSAERLAARRKKKLVSPLITPRYDNVYYEGLEWLDSLAGEKLPDGNKKVVFSDSIWKSQARSGDDFSG